MLDFSGSGIGTFKPTSVPFINVSQLCKTNFGGLINATYLCPLAVGSVIYSVMSFKLKCLNSTSGIIVLFRYPEIIFCFKCFCYIVINFFYKKLSPYKLVPLYPFSKPFSVSAWNPLNKINIILPTREHLYYSLQIICSSFV